MPDWATYTAAVSTGTSGLTTNLVSFWNFEDASGPRLDSYGINSLTNNGVVGVGSGMIGSASTFIVSSAQYLSQVNTATMAVSNQDFTVTGWYYLTTDGTFHYMTGHYDSNVSTARSWALSYVAASKRFSFEAWSATSSATVAATAFGAPSTATWIYILCQYAHNSALTITVNNVSTNSVTYTGGLRAVSVPFEIGGVARNSGGSGASSFGGSIDAVGFWKRLLTATEKAALYNSGAGVQWPL